MPLADASRCSIGVDVSPRLEGIDGDIVRFWRNLRVIVSVMKAVHRPATLGDVNRLFELRRQSITKLAAKAMSLTDAASWAEKLTIAGMEKKIRELEIWVAEVNGRGRSRLSGRAGQRWSCPPF